MSISYRKYWELLSRYIQPQRGRFALLAVLVLGNIVLQIANPQIMRYFIDTALSGGALQNLMIAAAGFIAIALIQQVVSVAATYLGENVAWTATNKLRAELAQHLLNLDMDFHNEHTPGEMIERIDGDVTELATFFSQFVVMVTSNSLLLVGILVALFREDWRIGLVFSVFAALSVFALNSVRDIGMVHQKAFRQATAEMYGYVEEQLAGTEDVRANGAVDYSLRELYRLQANIMRHDYKAVFKSWIISNVSGGMLALGMALAAVSGYFLYVAGAVTIGTVYLFIHYVELLNQPIWAMTRQIQDFQTIGACVERLLDLRKLQPKVVDLAPDLSSTEPVVVRRRRGSNGGVRGGRVRENAAQPDGSSPLALSFADVSFSYHKDDAVLAGLTFELQPGKVMGLLGRTGSGKSTLTRLVFRLYDPNTGSIRMDGKDIRGLPLQTLRRRIGIVTQEVQLFRASVRDNLTFFDRDIPDEQILAVLEDLELGEWFRGLPEGLNTPLETGGHGLSAGEGQLLAFARIFLRNPGLVILDEASSRLDPATEQRIERAIDKLLVGRTAIVIAHRLHTVHRADEIMILEDGRICEYGSREGLAGEPGSRFAGLLRTGMEEVLA
jgi:ABC-type multidrug transport system fused ATPase/permease subunit